MSRYALCGCILLSCGMTTYLMCSLSFPIESVCDEGGRWGTADGPGVLCTTYLAPCLHSFVCFLFFVRAALAIPSLPFFFLLFCFHTMVFSCAVSWA